MRAVALAMLGHHPDSEDVVQEATLIALSRIGDVRDPDAVGAWLRMIVRNACRAQLRRTSPVPMAEPPDPPGAGPDPADILERHALGDWIWTALDRLSPKLRLVTMLRYFTDVTSYAEIAAVCEAPVGTVRSRLSEARAKLSNALLTTADTAHDDATARNAVHRRFGEETFKAVERGSVTKALGDRWSPQLTVTWPRGSHTDLDYLRAAWSRDLEDGVRHRLRNVVAGRDVVIWEDELNSPPDDPSHCPPSVVWVLQLDGSRISRIRLFHPK